jgi:hypothetical protein
VYSILDYGAGYQFRYCLYFGGSKVLRTPADEMTVSYLLWHVNQTTVAQSSRYLLLHASGATHNGVGIVCPAASGSGKTTLVAGLVSRGLSYLSDEAIAIDPKTLDAHPYPKALAIDMGSWDVLDHLRPEDDPRFDRFRFDQWHIAPDAIRPGAATGACRIRLVVSPHYQLGSTTALEPVSPAQAVLLLAENSFNFASHRATGLDTLADVVRGCECYRLAVGSLDEACDAVIGLAEHVEVRV